MAIQFDRQGNYSRRLEAGLKVPKILPDFRVLSVAGNCIPAPKGRWQLPLSNIDETEGPRRGKEKYSQTLDSLSEYFMTDKWKRLHLVHFLLKIRGKIKGQRTFIPKAQKSWHLAKIIKNCGATTPTFTNWLKMSCTCPVKPFSAICQTLHFKQTCWISFEPPPQLRDWKFESFMSTAFDILVKNCNEFPFSAGLQLTLQTGLRPRPGDWHVLRRE